MDSFFFLTDTLKSRRDLCIPVNGENKELLLHRRGFKKKVIVRFLYRSTNLILSSIMPYPTRSYVVIEPAVQFKVFFNTVGTIRLFFKDR